MIKLLSNPCIFQKLLLPLHSQKENAMKKNITITRESGIEVFNKLGNEILNEMKKDFPLLREVLIRTCGPTYLMVVFSFDYTNGYSKIINYITEKYDLEYRYKEVNTINGTDDFIFYVK